MVDKFLDRTLAYNEQMIRGADRRGFLRIDVLQSGVAELADRCMTALNG